MNVKISVFAIIVEAIMYLLLSNFHDCTFNEISKSMFMWWYGRLPLKLLFRDILNNLSY